MLTEKLCSKRVLIPQQIFHEERTILELFQYFQNKKLLSNKLISLLLPNLSWVIGGKS